MRQKEFPASQQGHPDKWLKYLLLSHFGLASTEYLNSTIHRYAWQNRFDAVERIRAEMASSEAAGAKVLFVAKFVPQRLHFMLPNVRIFQMADLKHLEDKIRHLETKFYSELWFCRTDINAGCFSVAGRVLIDIRCSPEGHIIEQVWKCSPRLIESYNSTASFDYIRAVRPAWSWRPRVIECHIGNNNPSQTNANLIAEFSRSMKLLNNLVPRIRLFCEYLENLGNTVYSLEYKIEDSSVRVIDWDTQHDRRVLDDWFGANI